MAAILAGFSLADKTISIAEIVGHGTRYASDLKLIAYGVTGIGAVISANDIANDISEHSLPSGLLHGLDLGVLLYGVAASEGGGPAFALGYGLGRISGEIKAAYDAAYPPSLISTCHRGH